MELNSWPGLIAVVLAIISFYFTTYLVIALNVGWRFGYWLSSACFGALMVLMSLFWIFGGPGEPVGPRGEEPHWIPVAAAPGDVAQASFNEKTYTSTAQYPSGGWQPLSSGDLADQSDAIGSAIANCLSAPPERLLEEERDACSAAQELEPAAEDVPIIEGTAVTVTPEVSDLRFIEDNGATLAQATVTPITHDPRVAENAEEGEALGDSFRVVAIHDKGSLRIPAYGSLVISLLYAGFHLLGLHRAEQRKASPIAA